MSATKTLVDILLVSFVGVIVLIVTWQINPLLANYWSILAALSAFIFSIQKKSKAPLIGVILGIVALQYSIYVSSNMGARGLSFFDYFDQYDEFVKFMRFSYEQVSFIMSDGDGGGLTIDFKDFVYGLAILLVLLLYAMLRFVIAALGFFIQGAQSYVAACSETDWLIRRLPKAMSEAMLRFGATLRERHGAEYADTSGWRAQLLTNRSIDLFVKACLLYLALWAFVSGALFTIGDKRLEAASLGLLPAVTVQQWRDGITKLIWIGPWIFLLELAGSFRLRNGRRSPPKTAVAEPPPPKARHSVSGLKEIYRNSVGPLLVRELPPTADTTVRSPPEVLVGSAASELTPDLEGLVRRMTTEAAAASHLRSLKGLLEGKTSLILAESLVGEHFDLLAQLFQEVYSRGANVLLICPDHGVVAFRARLASQQVRWISYAVQKWCWLDRQVLDASQDFNVVVVPEGRFEAAFLTKSGEAERFLRRLGLVVVLGLDTLDLAILRLNLSRLWLHLSDQLVPVIVQGAGLDGLEPLAAQIFQPSPVARPGYVEIPPFDLWAFHPEFRSRRFVMAVDDHPDAVAAIDREYFKPGGIGAGCIGLLAAKALENGHEIIVDGGDLDCDRNSWQRLVEALKKVPGLGAMAPLLRVLYDEGNLPGSGLPVAITLDRGNAIGCLMRNPNLWGTPEILHLILSERYPLRGFLFHRLADGAPDHGVGEGLPMPLAPVLRGGVTELSYILLEEFANAGEVRRDRVLHHFALAPEALLHRLGVSPTKLGIERLFRLQFGRAPAIRLRETEGRETIFRADRNEVERLRLSFARMAVDRGSRPFGFDLPGSDLGLSYAKDTHVMASGYLYRILDVRGNQCLVERDDPRDQTTGQPRYMFVRRYHLDFRADSVAYEVGQSSLIGTVRVQSALMHACFRRDTIGYYRLDGSGGAGPDRRGPLFRRTNLTVNRRFATLLHIRLADLTPGGCFGGAGREVDLPVLARTLCISMTHVVQSLFPRQFHRIAVVSPLVPEYSGTPAAADLTFFPGVYPIVTETLGMPDDVADPDIRREMDWDAGTDAGLSLDLFLIEDGDLDLGVARAVYQNLFGLMTIMFDYVSFLLRPGTEDDVAFLGGTTYRDFDFAAVRDVLALIKQDSPRER